MQQASMASRPRGKDRRAITLKAALFNGLALLGAAEAHASVQMYGIIDNTIRYATNANAAKNSVFQLGEGPVTGSRFGLRGEESLGEGLKTFFLLEGGFDGGTGVSLQGSTSAGYGQSSTAGAGRLFGRQAYVGVSGALGALSLGRQYGVAYQAMATGQIFGNPNLDTLIIVANYTGSRQDNVVKYEGNLGPVTFGLHHAFGEVAGNTKANSSNGAAIGYASGGFKFNAAFQTISNATDSERRKSFGAAGSYSTGGVTATIGYLGNRYATSGTRNDVVMGGVSYQPSSQWKVGVGAFMDEQDNPGGRRVAVYGIADYFLSKRTDIYLALDHNRITGSYTLIRSQGTYGNQLGVSLGLRHNF